jgi:hypothetical protein
MTWRKYEYAAFASTQALGWLADEALADGITQPLMVH